MTPESRLIARIAEASTTRIARRVIRHLQQLKDRMSGDDSGLENVWDEICVQRQGQESFFWDAYDQTVRSLVEAHLDKLSVAELQAIWLQTNEGRDWLYDDDEGHRGAEVPWVQDDVADYIMQKIYNQAEDWSNRRIRTYLDNDWRDDP